MGTQKLKAWVPKPPARLRKRELNHGEERQRDAPGATKKVGLVAQISNASPALMTSPEPQRGAWLRSGA